MINSWHVATAAEAIAAAQFARCGWDVSVQYGANQPEYDLLIDNKKYENSLKISVKGSKDGSWGLTQSFLKEANYHAAVDVWLAKHSTRTIFCLVQFKGTDLTDMPRIYLATPEQIAVRLKATANNRGDTILYEKHVWTKRAHGWGTTEVLPEEWRFTEERLDWIAKHIDQLKENHMTENSLI
jgi:hypothetical protein